MTFEPNVGQARPGVQYIAHGTGYTVQLTPAGPILTVKGTAAAQLEMFFPGARATQPMAIDKMSGTTNYFLGKDQRAWRRRVPTYGKVRYANVYTGVDLIYFGSQNRLEYDFVVAPGADYSRIRIRFEGAGKPELNMSGELVFRRSADMFTQHAPLAYQEFAGTRRNVNARYRVLPGGDIALDLGAYDRRLPVTIDPTLSYASYLGGNNNDGIFGVKVDATGAAYVAGFSASANFKTTPGSVRPNYSGRLNSQQYFGFGDAFVAKINPAGTALVYCTYLGGNADDVALALAIDASGDAYVAGSTESSDFPTTAGAYQTRYGGGTTDAFYSAGDAFVVKLSPAGDRIIWSTYVGGTSNEAALGIDVDAAGNPTIVGETISTDFPTTANAISRVYRGGANLATHPSGDAFVARLNATGTALQYSSYIGGGSHDMARAVAVDEQGNTYIAGGTYSSDFPTTPGAFQTRGGVVETTASYDAAADDGFVMKIDAHGAIAYSTFLGGSYRDTAFGLAIDRAGSAYVTGRTKSNNFPVTAGALQKMYGGSGARATPGDSIDGDAFITKVNPTGSALVYSTYLGGTGDEAGAQIVVDADGNAYVAGYTLSTEFPVSSDALQKTFAGFGGQGLFTGLPAPEGDVNVGDAFVVKLDPAGKLLYSSFFGGSADDIATAIAIDSARNIYVGGITLSPNLPTGAPIQAAYGGGATLFPRGDAFFAKFNFGGHLALVPAKIAFKNTLPTTGTAGSMLSSPVTVQVTDALNTAIPGASVAFSATNATLDVASATTDAQGQASVAVTLGVVGTTTVTASVAGLAPLTASISVTAAATGPTITSVVNGASFQAPLAPGSWITLGGTDLATARADASVVPLPTNLGGVKVRVNDIQVPLLFVIGNQINAQIPYEIPTGKATATVEVNGAQSAAFSFMVQATAPGIFLYNGNRAVAQNVADDGTVILNTASNPITPGKLMLVYFTGQGALDNPVPTGTPSGSASLSRPVAPSKVTVGGQPAAVDFLGMTPGNISLGQANIHIPDLDAGDYDVIITIGGQPSNAAKIAIGPRQP